MKECNVMLVRAVSCREQQVSDAPARHNNNIERQFWDKKVLSVQN